MSEMQHEAVSVNRTLASGDANSSSILLARQANRPLPSNASIPNLDNSTMAINVATSNNISNISSNVNNKLTNSYIDLLTPPKMDNLVDLFSLCCSTAVIFGSLVPYIPQYLKIKRSMNADGFSTYVCLTLLLANILRIMFWFGHPFELPLLIQSFIVVAGMLAMMEICVRVKDKSSSYMISSIGGFNQARRSRRFLTGKLIDYDESNETMPIYSVLSDRSSSPLSGSCSYHQQEASIHINGSNDSTNSQDVDNCSHQVSSVSSYRREEKLSRNYLLKNKTIPVKIIKYSGLKHFWDWDDYSSYIKFLSLFTLILGILTYLLLDNYLFVECLGFVALFTESMLGMPQLIRNYAKRSTRGMSVEMVVMWLSGDLFKTLYFILKKAPIQFYVCGSIQVIVDILILGQVLWFKQANVTYRKLPRST